MQKTPLYISSEKFANGGLIPTKYTCDGENINPPLDIENLPSNAKSLVVILGDTEKEGKEAIQWLTYNVPAKNWISEDERKGENALNCFNEFKYSGPCPKNGAQRYLFKIYALDDYLYFPQCQATISDVEDGIRYHLLAYGELEGVYDREAKLELMRITEEKK